MRDSAPIFVVGGTGRHGGTGRAVIRSLIDASVPVRALARTRDERAEALAALGAEVVVGDLADRETLVPALEGVGTAYFTYPIAGGIVEAAASFASAARAAGVKRVVVLSMAPAHPQSPSHLGRAQWLAEEMIAWSGVDVLCLRIAGVFFENLELLHGREIAQESVMLNAFPDIPVNWVSGADVARLATEALLRPEKFGARTVVYPGSTEQYTQSEVAGLIGDFLGRRIEHRTISETEWCERIIRLAAHDPRISADMARHISAVAANLKEPFRPNDMIAEITGRPPMSLREALESGHIGFA